MPECPDCGQECADERGLNSHYGQMHGGSWKLNEATCEYCGESYKVKPSRESISRFCSKECLGQHNGTVRQGPSHPKFKEFEDAECKWCGDEFKHKPSENRLFCCKGCYTEWQRNSDYHAGENSPHWKDEPNTNWYGSNWLEQRQKRLEKDGYECVVCSISNEEHKERHGWALEVHHIQRIGDFIEDGELDYERANRLENLITLCRHCHRRWEGIPLKPDTR